MSDLQISLLGIGALVVVGVILFNRWQENKLQRQLAQTFEAKHGDALLQEAVPSSTVRIEPSVGSMEDMADDEVSLPQESQTVEEPAYEDTPLDLRMPPDLVDEPALSGNQPEELDATVEFVVRLHPGEPVETTALSEEMENLEAIGKPVRWVGLNDVSQNWENILPQGHATYSDLAVGMQLTDRSGPMTEAQLAAFCDAVQIFASRELAVLECPDKQQALQTAEELDRFCLDVDVLIGLNVVAQSGSAFPGTKIRALAEASGMQLQAEGVFHYLNGQGISLFSLCNHESSPFTAENIKSMSTHGVTLLFDVPRVPDGIAVFDEMISLGRKLASSLGGMLVDDNIRPLSDAGIDKIRQQLANIYQKMEIKQIPAGSQRALKLFS